MNIYTHKVQTLIEIVIKKGGGIRPYEALATSRFIGEGAKFYCYTNNFGVWIDN